MGSSYDVQFEHPYSIAPEAFNNPVGNQAGNWNTGMQNMLGATTGTAPQAGNTQLGGTAQIGKTALSQGQNMGNTATYGGAKLNANQYNSTFGQEQQLANQLGMQAKGLGPSVAQVTAEQQAGQNLQNQMAMLGSQRGSSNPALAQQAALRAGSDAQQQAAQQAVLGRTQEALGAQANQANLLGAMNQQAQGFTTAQAGLEQQALLQSMGAINSQNAAQAQLAQQNQQFNAGNMNAQQLAQAQMYQQSMLQQGQMNQQTQLANLQAALAQGQINAQQYNQYMSQLAAQNMAQYQGQIEGQKLGVNQQLGIGGIESGSDANQTQNTMTTVGTIAGAAAMAMSDNRVKKQISLAEKEVDKDLKKLFKMVF
jgi:hypothetical protein